MFFDVGPTFKILYHTNFGVLISYQLKRNFWTPNWSPRPPKCKNFEIYVFQRRPFQIWYYTNFRSLISYQQTNFGLVSLCLPFLAPKGQNCEKVQMLGHPYCIAIRSLQKQLYQSKPSCIKTKHEKYYLRASTICGRQSGLFRDRLIALVNKNAVHKTVVDVVVHQGGRPAL